MARRVIFKEVVSIFNNFNLVLLENTYVNNKTKMKYKCLKCNYKNNTTLGIINSESYKGCPRCNNTIYKYRIEDVSYYLKLESYGLLSDEYTNHTQRLKIKCSNGHITTITFRDWIQGCRCKKCYLESVRPSMQELKVYFKKYNYKLMSTSYKESHTKLKCKCSEGHIFKVNWANFKNGSRCPTCAIINNSGKNNYNWKGGTSSAPYCDAWKDKQYKSDIRKRDDNTCQNPYCYKTTKKLHIHHIDYDKKNCHPSNLITVCGSCNSRANKDRTWHTKWYRILMNKKFSYVYNNIGGPYEKQRI